MKKLYLLILLFLVTAGSIFAMDNNSDYMRAYTACIDGIYDLKHERLDAKKIKRFFTAYTNLQAANPSTEVYRTAILSVQMAGLQKDLNERHNSVIAYNISKASDGRIYIYKAYKHLFNWALLLRKHLKTADVSKHFNMLEAHYDLFKQKALYLVTENDMGVLDEQIINTKNIITIDIIQ